MSKNPVETRIAHEKAQILIPTREEIRNAGGRLSGKRLAEIRAGKLKTVAALAPKPSPDLKKMLVELNNKSTRKAVHKATPVKTKGQSKRQAKQPVVDAELQVLRDGLKAARLRNQNK